MEKKVLSEYVREVFETASASSDWFGYYNYDPLDSSNTRMLCNRAPFDAREIRPDDSIELGWYDIPSGEWHTIDTTNAFNWQQGAMLQWRPQHPTQVVYNSVANGKYISFIFDVVTGEKRKIDWPIYGLTPDGKLALSLNYERSYWCRAYHYQPIRNDDYDVPVAEDDGIFRVDLETGSVDRIVRIQDVLAVDADPSFEGKKHWVEHIMINREGTRFVFLHRFSGEDVFRYQTRVLVCNIDGSQLQVVPGWRNNDWSHIGWQKENAFTVFTVKKGAVAANQKGKTHGSIYQFAKRIYKNILSPILGKKLAGRLESSHEYQVYQIEESGIRKTDTYNGNIGFIDGHPTFTADGLMITDTYPDKEGYQHLQAYSPKSRKCIELGTFFAPLSGNPASCDLHPKLSRNNAFVMVDTAYTGKHKMILLALNWEKILEDLK